MFQDFVKLYADFLLNESIKDQFKAFLKGFKLVAGESRLLAAFRPEEVEQLVCGTVVSSIFEKTDV
jgi:hypothetical protein